MIDASDKGAQICHNWISSPCRHIQMNARQYQEPVDLPVQPIRHATNIHSLTPPRTDRHLSQSANACWLVVGGWCFGFFWEGPLSTLLMEKCQESKPPGPQTNNEPLSLAQLFDKDRNILQPVTGERENILWIRWNNTEKLKGYQKTQMCSLKFHDVQAFQYTRTSSNAKPRIISTATGRAFWCVDLHALQLIDFKTQHILPTQRLGFHPTSSASVGSKYAKGDISQKPRVEGFQITSQLPFWHLNK